MLVMSAMVVNEFRSTAGKTCRAAKLPALQNCGAAPQNFGFLRAPPPQRSSSSELLLLRAPPPQSSSSSKLLLLRAPPPQSSASSLCLSPGVGSFPLLLAWGRTLDMGAASLALCHLHGVSRCLLWADGERVRHGGG
ncbi:unnamed protein product [Boreogadus saida]